jgi:hypothetical protein
MEDHRLVLARRLVAESLTKLHRNWIVKRVRDPGTTAVVVAQVHGSVPSHVELAHFTQPS